MPYLGPGVEQIPTGSMFDYLSVGTAPSGYIYADGRTIGNASSGATNLASSLTRKLYILLWNNFPNSILPVSGGRGASALADFNANKTITLPDLRGRTTFGLDNMGGTPANRITSGISAINGTQIGATGGAQSVVLGISTMPSHTHPLWYDFTGSLTASPFGNGNNVTLDTSPASGAAQNGSLSVGGGGGFSPMPPTFITTKIIKL